MKRKASVSHDEAMTKELRENPEFAVEYLRAALAEGDDPQTLLIALRRSLSMYGNIFLLRSDIQSSCLCVPLTPMCFP